MTALLPYTSNKFLFRFWQQLKEIKFEKMPKPTRKNRKAAMRKNMMRDRSASDADIPLGTPVMRPSKSMTDLSNIQETESQNEALNLSGGNSDREDDRNSLPFPGHTSTFQSTPTMVHSKSASDINHNESTIPVKETLPIVNNSTKPLKRPLMKLKRLLKKTPASKPKVNSNAEETVLPVITMRSCKSVSDLSAEFAFADEGSSDLSQSLHVSGLHALKSKGTCVSGTVSSSAENISDGPLKTPCGEQKKTLGSMFGSTLSPLHKGLTLSCDILTAAVTPTDDDDNVTFNISSTTTTTPSSASNCCSIESLSGVDNSDVTDIYLNVQTDVTVLKSHSTQVQGSFSGPKDEGNSVAHQKPNSPTTGNQRRRVRPPPPSYPPPPLPDKIIIHV